MMTLINPSKHYDDVCLPVDRLLLLSDERERDRPTKTSCSVCAAHQRRPEAIFGFTILR